MSHLLTNMVLYELRRNNDFKNPLQYFAQIILLLVSNVIYYFIICLNLSYHPCIPCVNKLLENSLKLEAKHKEVYLRPSQTSMSEF